MELKRNFDILYQLKEKYKDVFQLSVKRKGKWEYFSTEQYVKNTELLAMGLLELGIQKGDKILTMSNNRPEWNFLDMAMGMIGAIHVPVYTNLHEDELLYIIEHSEARLIVVSSAEFYLKIKPLADKVQRVENVYMFDEISGVPNWKDILELGQKNKERWQEKLKEIRKTIDQDDLLSIIYTSGTTGKPKGVMLTHYNFMSNVQATIPRYNLKPGNRYMSILPICHVFEREVNYLVQAKGVSICYAQAIDTFVNDIKECKANGFAAVPRLYERVFNRIQVEGKKLIGLKRKIFDWAVNIALKFDPNKKAPFGHSIVDKLVYKKWRDALGGEIIGLISGGAALQPRLARVFHAAGMPVYEGYGLTETSPVIAVNYSGHIKIGTVGPILENVQVKIADDGEILCKGPNVMKGYYKDPEKTKEAIDPDGWFHTGDIGELDEDNYLRITDRKKEMFKLDTGKYVAPQVIENIFKESPLIDQLFVVGAGEKFVAAIISPNFEYLNGWAYQKGIIYRDAQELIKHPKVIERFQEEVDKYNKRLSHHEQIKKFALTCRKWTPETGELSPTLKLKRNYLKKLYKTKLDYIYGYTDDPGDLGPRIRKLIEEEKQKKRKQQNDNNKQEN